MRKGSSRVSLCTIQISRSIIFLEFRYPNYTIMKLIYLNRISNNVHMLLALNNEERKREIFIFNLYM